MKLLSLVVLVSSTFLTGCLHSNTQPQDQAFVAPKGNLEDVQQVKQVINVDGSIATLDMAEFAHRR